MVKTDPRYLEVGKLMVMVSWEQKSSKEGETNTVLAASVVLDGKKEGDDA